MNNVDIDLNSKNFLEEVVNNYIQLPTNENEHIKYGINQMTKYLNLKKGKVLEKDWQAYFDLLFFEENHQKFEKATELYTKVTLKSPPIWRDFEVKKEHEATNVIKFSDLYSISKARIEDFIDTVKNELAYSRIDFSNTDFTRENKESIELLKTLFYEIQGCKCQIIGQINLTNFLENKVKEDSTDQSYWLLLLAIYQCVGNRTDYENLAMEYVIKFEESVLDYKPQFVLISEENKIKQLDIMEMSKEVDKSEIVQLTYLLNEKLMQEEKMIEIDFNNTQTIYYSALEELSKFILKNSELIKEKSVFFKNVNRIVLTAMEVMGIDFNLISYKMVKY